MKEYCKKYQKAILLALLFSLVCFGFMLTNFTVTIDEETWLLGNEESALWLLQGRISIWLFNLLFTQAAFPARRRVPSPGAGAESTPHTGT